MDPNFESPFTWGIADGVVLTFNENEWDAEDDLPFLNFMNSLMATFIYAQKGDYNAAKNNFLKMDNLWSIIDKDQLLREQVCIDTLEHIVQSTKYYALLKLQNCIEDKNSQEELKQFQPLVSVMSISTLNGCKSIAWSIFFETGMKEAITFARLATFGNQGCSMWHFMLGKNLRRFRRETAFFNYPSQEEVNSFLKAYEICKNPLYGIYVAKIYLEKNECDMSRQVTMEIFRQFPRNIKIQLRLALCLIRVSNYPKAKLCLDYAEKYSPDSAMYLHYRGLFYKKQDNYECAAKYLKKAANFGIFGADLQYGMCMSKIYPDFSFIAHLLNMKKKFGYNKIYLQSIYLHIALENYYIQNYEKSLMYFQKAVKLLPNGKILQCFYFRTFKQSYNIFDFVNDTLIPEYKSVYHQDLPFMSLQYIQEIKNAHVSSESSNNTNDTITTDSEINLKTLNALALLILVSTILIIFMIVY